MIISNAISLYSKWHFTLYFVNKLLVDDTKNISKDKDLKQSCNISDYCCGFDQNLKLFFLNIYISY